MITLYTFGPYFGLPDASPFVYKAMALLKMAQIPYTTQIVAPKNLSKAPKGKLPYIEDDGEVIADSTLIRWHIEKKYKFDFDKALSPTDRASAWALERMLEDHVYWLAVKMRWADDANFAKGPSHFFDGLPAPIRPLVRAIVRKRAIANLHGHGLGRHDMDDLVALATKDFSAISTLLGGKTFLFGDTPCGADATALAFLEGVLCPHFEHPVRDCAALFQNLVSYVSRIKAMYFE